MGGPYRKHQAAYRRPQSSGRFVLLLGGSALVAGAVGWLTQPYLAYGWQLATRTSDEIAAIERSVYYPDCAAARAVGKAPVWVGTPGYRIALDRDGDGIACEPHL
ncbi:MAG: hypothetical protein CVT77_05515 [Alphaproteobacteria bacterium HGW-Alphaproteobacteria-16]|nr:MAG: hypothetical protein CVT77_05515 [Alphaproteobacteria bacterium HGW-Alphaproteobacteria-16]